MPTKGCFYVNMTYVKSIALNWGYGNISGLDGCICKTQQNIRCLCHKWTVIGLFLITVSRSIIQSSNCGQLQGECANLSATVPNLEISYISCYQSYSCVDRPQLKWFYIKLKLFMHCHSSFPVLPNAVSLFNRALKARLLWQIPVFLSFCG